MIAEIRKIWPSKPAVAVNILGRISTPNSVVQGPSLGPKNPAVLEASTMRQAYVTDLTTKGR